MYDLGFGGECLMIISRPALSSVFLAPYLFDLAFEKVIKVAATAHPSRLQIPQDLEVRMQTIPSFFFIGSSFDNQEICGRKYCTSPDQQL